MWYSLKTKNKQPITIPIEYYKIDRQTRNWLEQKLNKIRNILEKYWMMYNKESIMSAHFKFYRTVPLAVF